MTGVIFGGRSYEYDSRGKQTVVRTNVKQSLAGVIDSTDAKETTYTYDHRGRRIKRTLPEGQTEERFYDDTSGHLSYIVDEDGRVTQYVYSDQPGQSGALTAYNYYSSLIQFNNGNGTPEFSESYDYSEEGTLVEVDGPEGKTKFTRNNLGELTRIENAAGVINYEYNDYGEITRVYTADPATPTIVVGDTLYSYDQFGRIDQVTVVARNGVTLSTSEVTTYEYTLTGKVHQVWLPNGVITQSDYTNTGRLDLITHYAPDVTPNDLSDNDVIAEFDYAYFSDGTQSGVEEKIWEDDGSGTWVLTVDQEFEWTYDNQNRLIDEIFTNHLDSLFDYTTNYDYSITGNRLKKTTDQGSNGTIDETITYTYDDNDRLLVEDGKIVNGSVTTAYYTYGGTGDPITQLTGKDRYIQGTSTLYEQTTYTHDAKGRLVSTTSTRTEHGHSLDITASYVYDYRDERIKSDKSVTVDSGTPETTATYYLVDHYNPTGYSQVLEERDTTSLDPTRTFTIGLKTISQDDAASGEEPLYLLADGRSSTRVLVDDMTDTIETYTYDAYGLPVDFVQTANPDDATETDRLFTGEQFDTALNMEYLRARYYDVGAGRFMALDPFPGLKQDPDTLHRYMYVANNPIQYGDPSGKLLIAFDGTANHDGPANADGSTNYMTNVWKIWKDFHTIYPHWNRYYRGVGNPIDDIAWGPDGLMGGAFGAGARSIIERAITYVEDKIRVGPEVDVIGFSRGSATALEFAHTFEESLPGYSIRFMGLFDVVGSFGYPGNYENYSFDLSLSPIVNRAVHAMAFDENRNFFPATNIDSKKVKQVAFRGVHSDIGGGWPDTQPGLQDNAKKWMREQYLRTSGASLAGNYPGGDVIGTPTVNPPKWGKSYRGGWSDTGYLRPTIQQGLRHVMTLGDFADHIDFSRLKRYADYTSPPPSPGSVGPIMPNRIKLLMKPMSSYSYRGGGSLTYLLFQVQRYQSLLQLEMNQIDS